jgi:hypothetical protein
MKNDGGSALRDYEKPITLDECRVYRQIALPVSAFDTLQQLKRKWRLRTNAEVLTRLLLAERLRQTVENDGINDRNEARHDNR